jgi:hypothetical protein
VLVIHTEEDWEIDCECWKLKSLLIKKRSDGILNEAQEMVNNALKSTIPGREPAEGKR